MFWAFKNTETIKNNVAVVLLSKESQRVKRWRVSKVKTNMRSLDFTERQAWFGMLGRDLPPEIYFIREFFPETFNTIGEILSYPF